MIGGIWKLTQLGKKRVSSIYSREARNSILAYLKENHTASVEELSNISGKSTSEVRVYLRRAEKQEGLVEQIGGA